MKNINGKWELNQYDISQLAHELKTPLNPMINLSRELMNNISNMDSSEIMETLELINESSMKLLDTVNNFIYEWDSLSENICLPTNSFALSLWKYSLVNIGTNTMNATKIKVLIVDDEILNLKIAEKCFLCKWFQEENIIKVENWEKAIEEIKKWWYDIVIMDYNMPGITWFEACEQIRQFNTEVVIILSTTNIVDKNALEKCWFDWSANKPIDFISFIPHIKEIFEKKHNKKLVTE